MYGFTKEERSSFQYRFAHWCAFQMVALNCHKWKFKHLFHRTSNKNNTRNSLMYVFLGGLKPDWETMIIDWECSRFTKPTPKPNVRDRKEMVVDALRSLDMCDETVSQLSKLGVLPNEDDYFGRIEFEAIVDKIDTNLDKVIRELGL